MGGGRFARGLLGSLAWSLTNAKAETPTDDLPATSGPAWRDALFVLGGLTGLVVGSELLVSGATTIAATLGVPDAVIGLTVVAVGTSLPELATSVVASRRDEGAIAAGNIVGSNLFNLLGILGVAGLVRPLEAPGLEVLDVALMGGLTLAMAGMMLTSRRVVRTEAGLLLAAYVVYTSTLVLQNL